MTPQALTLALSALAWPEGAGLPVALEAPLVVADATSLEASGGVVVWVGAGSEVLTLRGSRVRVDLVERSLEVDGPVTLEGAGASMSAARAAVDSHGATLDGLACELADVSVVAERARVDDAGLTLEGVVLSPCPCEPPTWDLTGRRVEVADGRLWVEGARLRLGEVPVLPLPRMLVPLEPPVVRPGLPEVAWAADRLRVTAPVLVRAEGATFTLRPGWWGGPRGEADVDWDGFRLGMGAGLTGGVASAEARAGGGRHTSSGWRMAGEGALGTDPGWLVERAPTWGARQAPWTSGRWVLGWGPVRAEAAAFQGVHGVAPGPPGALGVALTSPTLARDGVWADFGGRLDVVEEGTPALAATGTLAAGVGGDAGRLLYDGSVEVAGVLAPAGRGGAVAGQGQVVVPTWTETGRGVAVVRPGLAGSAATGGGLTDAWRAGPMVQVLGPGGAWARAWGTWGHEGFSGGGPGGQVVAGAGERLGLRGAFEAGPAGWLVAGGPVLRLDGGGAGLAVLAGDDLPGVTARASAEAGWSVRGGEVLARVEGQAAWAGTPQPQELGLSGVWASGCGCLVVDAGVLWAADRQVPDARLGVRLLPGRW